MDKLKPISLSIREGQLEKLQALSNRTDAPVAALIRRAIDMLLEDRKAELPPNLNIKGKK